MTDTSAWMPIHRIAPLLASGALDPVALMEATLDRIARLDPQLHAFDFVARDEALAAAEAARAQTRRGEARGPLHGVPVAVKDLCAVAGWPIRCGSATWTGRRSDASATVVGRLRQAGAIIVGKTHMVEFAFGAWGTNRHLGTPLNPWDLGVPRVPGGSSSGSGVAVGAGLVPAAIGSDTGGSIRVPAALCGIVGLKPTVGRISRAGTVALSRTLDSLGPMTRSVRDAALLLAVMQGPDPGDRETLLQPAGAPAAALDAGVAGLRLGILPEAETAGLNAAVGGAYAEAARVFARLGATIVPVPFQDVMDETGDAVGAMIATEGYSVVREIVDDEAAPTDPAVRHRFRAGRGISAVDYFKLLDHREGMLRRAAERIAGIDALLLPTCPTPPIAVAEVDEAGPPMSRYTRAGNYLGWCGLAVPAGLTPEGLPLSVQILGRAFDEATILRAGQAFEQATDWHMRHAQV